MTLLRGSEIFHAKIHINIFREIHACYLEVD